MASKSRRIANINGASVGPLKAVPSVDSSKGLVANAVKASPAQQREATKQILLAIKQFAADSRQDEMLLDAKMSDILLGRIASLMDEVMASFADDQLAAMKKEILDEVSGLTASGVLKNFLLSQLTELFDTDAKKEDIEELKAWMMSNFSTSSKQAQPSSEAENEDEEAEDAVEGDYRDSTPAKNFQTLNSFIDGQMKALNTNISKMTGNFGVISAISMGLSKTVGGIAKGVSFVAKGVAKTISKTAAIAKSVVTVPFKAMFAGIAGLAKGIKGIAGGIAGIGKKVGGALASPFKAIGGFFSKLNPFSRSRKEDRKQKLRDRIMDKIGNIIDKMWKVIEPFIDKVVLFMSVMFMTVVLPIALIAAKVLLIVAALVLIGLGLYLAYKWVTAKVKWFWNYVKSGKMWEDIKAKMIAAWEWMKDFGKWLGAKLVDFGKWWLKTLVRAWKFLLVDIPVWIWEKLCDFGKWIWDKLCEFGQWLYDNYIYKYLVKPFMDNVWNPLKNFWNTKVWPVIEPFVKSLTDLKDRIVKAFSAWDTSKSIWENLKNIGGIIKDSVMQWWDESPFKTFYESKIKPFVDSLTDLKNRIVSAFSQWDSSKSIWENLKRIGGIIKDAVVEWWDESPFKTFYETYLEPFVNDINAFVDKITNAFSQWDTSKSIWDNLKNVGSILIDSIAEWYDKSALKQAIDPLIDLIKLYVVAPLTGIKTYLIRAFVNLADKLWFPRVNMNWGNYEWTSPVDSLKRVFSFDKVYPLKGLVTDEMRTIASNAEGKSMTDIINEEMTKVQRDIDKANTVDATTPKDIAAQQVSQAAAPLQSIDSMKQQQQIELKKNGDAVVKDIEKKEENQQKADADFAKKQDELIALGKANLNATNENAKNPTVMPMPLPMSQQQNPATMESN